MNDDELKAIWRRQPLREPPSTTQLVSAMQNKTTRLRGCLDARDLRELVACAVVVVVFTIFYFTVYREPISRLGDLIIIGGAIFIAWKLVYTRRSHRPAPPGATVVESLRAELNAVHAQSRLLGSVFWWYLLPLTAGEIIATWGLRIAIFPKIFCTAFFLAVNAFIYWLNQQARTKQLLPVEAQLEALLHSAETGEPVDQKEMTNLRPIVLSLAATDQVKPVEFKVAFSQIAIYAEIGFVGMWFFWMLSLTIDNAGSKTAPRAPNTIAPIFQIAETNRYSDLARKVVEPLNKSDYAAIEKLFNPGMNKAFPPEKASEFFSRIVTGYGHIEKVEGPVANGYHDWTAFRLHCQRGSLIMSLALDVGGKIDGIYFQPASAPPGNTKSLVVRFLAWRHLLWLTPFFLGGLVFAWLLQKTTRRAVGISALGIHLAQGIHLILWDEIKEVRPLRILNIRSLWLIKESGEKTIMPWTGLDRHSELKDAVEASAPANHPIRQYLSLLKRI
jgi:hypothetical protein